MRRTGVVEERDGERTRLKLWTQERQPDRQATCSHGNSKWRERGREVEKNVRRETQRKMSPGKERN